MKSFLSRIIYSIGFRLLGREATLRLIEKYLRYSNTDLIPFACRQMGIMKWQTLELSGERHFTSQILPGLLGTMDGKDKVMLDVGANKGDYARMLRSIFPEARLHLFEPNPGTFQRLKTSLPQDDRLTLNLLGLSGKAETATLYFDPGEPDAGLASLHSNIFSQIHLAAKAETVAVQLTTLDDYCAGVGIASIDFLKIDTEGHELEVLKGARAMLAAGAIRVIQFEFNEMNVVTRVFLKDFYDLLPGFRFYRLDTDRLIPLYDYHPANEIFQFQNIVAIHPAVAHV